MSPLGCEVVQDLLPLYREGEVQEKTRLEVAEHLRGCPRCRQLCQNGTNLRELLRKLEDPGRNWQRERKVVIRARRRLRALLGVVVVFLLCLSLLPPLLSARGVDDGLRALTLLTEMTNPGLQVTSAGSSVSPFARRIRVEAARILAGASLKQEAGIDWRGRLFLIRSAWEPTHIRTLPWPLLPDDPHPPEAARTEREILDRLPAWSAAEAVVSFGAFLSPEQVDSLVEGKNLTVTWVAFDAGEARPPRGDGKKDSPTDRSTLGFALRGSSSVAARSEQFRGDLAWLGRRYVQVRGIVAYPPVSAAALHVEQAGFGVFGMVVTGAAADIQSLGREEPVRSVILGEVVFRR